MRVGLVVSSVATVIAAASLHAFQGSVSATLLAQARQALGGERALAAITSFTAKGNVTLPGARGTASGTFEIACALPERFVQTEDTGEFWAGDSVSSASGGGFEQHTEHTKVGFVGERLIYLPPLVYNGTAGEKFAAITPEARVKASDEARAGFVNLTLGMFATSFAGVPLNFDDVPEANAVLVTGKGFSATLRFDPVTHLPAELVPEAHGPVPLGKWVPRRVTYADYRDVKGVKLPFRISDGVETWTVKKFEINPRIDQKTFGPFVSAQRP